MFLVKFVIASFNGFAGEGDFERASGDGAFFLDETGFRTGDLRGLIDDRLPRGLLDVLLGLLENRFRGLGERRRGLLLSGEILIGERRSRLRLLPELSTLLFLFTIRGGGFFSAGSFEGFLRVGDGDGRGEGFLSTKAFNFFFSSSLSSSSKLLSKVLLFFSSSSELGASRS